MDKLGKRKGASVIGVLMPGFLKNEAMDDSADGGVEESII
jgi:hypothetical protein